MEKSGTFKIPGWTVGWNVKLAVKRREGTRVVGVTNKIGHLYVPFFDYDTREQSIVENDVRSLQEEYLLGDAYLFNTGNGFHVIMLDLLTGREWAEILDAANCDEEYKTVPQKSGARAWVLRFTPKRTGAVTFSKTLPGFLGRNLSRPHYNYLLKRGVPFDDLQRLRVYTTHDANPLIYATYEA